MAPEHQSNQSHQLAASLRSAAGQGKVDLVRLLIRCGADVNGQDEEFGNTPLHLAAWNGFSQTVALLCKHRASTSIKNKAQFSPLHLASQQGHNQTARLLLMAHARTEAKNNYGDTPLHTAARYGHAGVARILLSAKCNANQVNKNHDTPLHIAAAMGRRKLTRIFMQNGAEPAIKNKQDETAMDIALRKDLISIQELIANPPPADRKRARRQHNCGARLHRRLAAAASSSKRRRTGTIDSNRPPAQIIQIDTTDKRAHLSPAAAAAATPTSPAESRARSRVETPNERPADSRPRPSSAAASIRPSDEETRRLMMSRSSHCIGKTVIQGDKSALVLLKPDRRQTSPSSSLRSSVRSKRTTRRIIFMRRGANFHTPTNLGRRAERLRQSVQQQQQQQQQPSDVAPNGRRLRRTRPLAPLADPSQLYAIPRKPSSRLIKQAQPPNGSGAAAGEQQAANDGQIEAEAAAAAAAEGDAGERQRQLSRTSLLVAGAPIQLNAGGDEVAPAARGRGRKHHSRRRRDKMNDNFSSSASSSSSCSSSCASSLSDSLLRLTRANERKLQPGTEAAPSGANDEAPPIQMMTAAAAAAAAAADSIHQADDSRTLRTMMLMLNLSGTKSGATSASDPLDRTATGPALTSSSGSISGREQPLRATDLPRPAIERVGVDAEDDRDFTAPGYSVILNERAVRGEEKDNDDDDQQQQQPCLCNEADERQQQLTSVKVTTSQQASDDSPLAQVKQPAAGAPPPISRSNKLKQLLHFHERKSNCSSDRQEVADKENANAGGRRFLWFGRKESPAEAKSQQADGSSTVVVAAAAAAAAAASQLGPNAELIRAQKSLALAAAAKVQRDRLVRVASQVSRDSSAASLSPGSGGSAKEQQQQQLLTIRTNGEPHTSVAPFWLRLGTGLQLNAAATSGTSEFASGVEPKRPSCANSVGMSDSSPSNNGADSDNSIQTRNSSCAGSNGSKDMANGEDNDNKPQNGNGGGPSRAFGILSRLLLDSSANSNSNSNSPARQIAKLHVPSPALSSPSDTSRRRQELDQSRSRRPIVLMSSNELPPTDTTELSPASVPPPEAVANGLPGPGPELGSSNFRCNYHALNHHQHPHMLGLHPYSNYLPYSFGRYPVQEPPCDPLLMTTREHQLYLQANQGAHLAAAANHHEPFAHCCNKVDDSIYVHASDQLQSDLTVLPDHRTRLVTKPDVTTGRLTRVSIVSRETD